MTLPELEAEISAEARARVEAYLPTEWLDLTIAGWPVRPLTLERLSVLEALGNPLVVGGPVPPEAVLQFLWVLDAGFPGDKARRKKLTAWAGAKSYIELAEACRQFVREQCADVPGTSELSGVPCASTAAYMVHLLASSYGWGLRDIMALPMQVVVQQIRVVAKANNPRLIMFNQRSDAAKARYLQELAKSKEVANGSQSGA